MLCGRLARTGSLSTQPAGFDPTIFPKPSTDTQMNTILTIDQQGTVTGLYTELIDLRQLGRLEITRATTIEFNPATQEWDVTDAGGVSLFSDASRSRCLAWEHQLFNQ